MRTQYPEEGFLQGQFLKSLVHRYFAVYSAPGSACVQHAAE